MEGVKKPKGKTRNRQPGAPSYVDPREARKGETIGGGWFVFRRTNGARRVRTPEFPFEHASEAEAVAEAQRLAERHPGHRFEVYRMVATHSTHAPVALTAI